MEVQRRAILRVLSGGPVEGSHLVLPGEGAVVGRDDPCDLIVPRDRAMSSPHFELRWDGARCAIADLGSAEGTLVDGERVAEAEVGHGGWIRAGSTDLLVYFEKAERPAAPASTAAAQALEVLRRRAAEGTLYAVVDGARDERLLPMLRQSVEVFESLYEGRSRDALAEAAPYLVKLPEGSALLEELVGRGWGRAWAMYLVSSEPLPRVRKQLRTLLLVHDEREDRQLYFRFHDPRVMRIFFPTCTERQKLGLLGEVIDAFRCEGRAGEVLRSALEGEAAAGEIAC
ncbi:MAG TPA: DUF4123 domain-containing protein [Candidatus Nanopelagicales bacterium]|nr:DUF4123 domain-containing protein [Candidatus Nanopelagicales bacterium]